MNKKIGEIWKTKEGYFAEIIEYVTPKNYTIILDNNIVLKNKTYQNITKGEIKNPYHPSVYQIGFIGVGDYKTSKDKKPTLSYKCWNSMLQRCYDKKFIIKNSWYKGCSVELSWHNFQNFAKWFEENYIEGYELDKDIILKENKIYSSKSCSFVPKEINNLLVSRKKLRGNYPIGVSKLNKKYLSQISLNGINHKIGIFNTIEEAFLKYKEAKEKQIQLLANKFKTKLNYKTYNSLMNYSIQINN